MQTLAWRIVKRSGFTDSDAFKRYGREGETILSTVTAGPSATDGKTCFLNLRLPAVIGCHGRIPQFAVRDGSILLKSQGNGNSTQGLYCFSSIVMMMIFS
jgi:hypothetical protein